MDIPAFKKFSSSLSKLSGLQIGQLLAQLETLDSNLQALTALEQGSEAQPACPHCQNNKTVCWGRTRTGLQRRRCKGCLKTFCATTKTTLAGVHKPGLFYKVLKNMFDDTPLSCRRLGVNLSLDKMTIWRWRHKILQALSNIKTKQLGGILEADEKFFRESRKGSHEWVNHQKYPDKFPKPERPRWCDYRRLGMRFPSGLSRFQIPVLTVINRTGNASADVLTNHLAETLTGTLSHHVAPDAVLCSDGDPAFSQFAVAHSVTHYALNATKGTRIIGNAFHIQTVNSLHDRFERFMSPFRGPATKYLKGYTAWFMTRSVHNAKNAVSKTWQALLAA